MDNKVVYNDRALVEVTKEFTFDSCHRLLSYNGACARFHGHTYKLQVTVEGMTNDIGLVIDFKLLKSIVKNEIVSRVDHYVLNEVMNFNTTAENMVMYFFDILADYIDKYSHNEGRYIKLKEVKLWETPTSFATYRGTSIPSRGL